MPSIEELLQTDSTEYSHVFCYRVVHYSETRRRVIYNIKAPGKHKKREETTLMGPPTPPTAAIRRESMVREYALVSSSTLDGTGSMI